MTLVREVLSVPDELRLDTDLVDLAFEIVGSRSSDCYGGQWAVWTERQLAIKMPFSPHLAVTEARIARELKRGGLNVPTVYGVWAPQEIAYLRPFIVMERLPIVPIQHYAPIWSLRGLLKRRKLRRKFNEQIELAKDAGYILEDHFIDHNCGVDGHENVWLYDFGDARSIR